MTDPVTLAKQMMGGKQFSFSDADMLWRALRDGQEVSRAHAVLALIRDAQSGALSSPVPPGVRDELCRQQAMLVSKDPELGASSRHDRALAILAEQFDLDTAADAETLGVAAGILKRRWVDLGQLSDLQRAASLYHKGAAGTLGSEAYTQINAAFTQDLLAAAGDNPDERRATATALRERIVADLAPTASWWTRASRAEAFVGLGRYREAQAEIEREGARPAPWQLETTGRQLASLAHLHLARPLDHEDVREFFEALLPGSGVAIRSVFVGSVGLALSGGGFRASFFHLGLLARMAELDLLRHVEVLSCVSGGSIVGASYWLELRSRLLSPKPLTRQDYVTIVNTVIERFVAGVESDVRGSVQEPKRKIAWRVLVHGVKGAMNSAAVADHLEAAFYRPSFPGAGTMDMHDLPFTPADYDGALTGTGDFSPSKHNWLRANKVPVLVINATTINTGHGWQFTPTWMGESPWAIHEAADSIPRLEWSYYDTAQGWTTSLGRAVAASACVPGLFTPVTIGGSYEGLSVQLVDGGVYDNQGTVSLLSLGCNVVIASDASGQMLLSRGGGDDGDANDDVKDTLAYLKRSFDAVSARVRMANFADLDARRRSGLLRGLIFVHMKDGLDAEPIRLRFVQESYRSQHRAPLSPAGIRKDFQEAIANLRTDLDAFTSVESDALMAAGYQLAKVALERDLPPSLLDLASTDEPATWPFDDMLADITSAESSRPRRAELLDELRAGHKVRT